MISYVKNNNVAQMKYFTCANIFAVCTFFNRSCDSYDIIRCDIILVVVIVYL